ncbi:unnamed protein product [Rotaria sp. Silwood1]|nr:unnamed protein product [Rotaria sp. Silwood1]CAF3555340.1 unnamed protein product [Rotaria sp. Silwood1]CAF3584845.1 unnamed protein product [Rotaria sp. Silwood1]CAF4902022.1 unnamed protein product [Rotaria sp. Silwood1]CAF5002184.1 unnamed protein product [Rotaria sp. Silwood1]
MKSLFRSRIPPELTPTQITSLSTESHLPAEDIKEWYERFNHCYPRGYLSYKEFISYLQQVNTQNGNDNRLTKSMVKQLFNVLDLNEDKHLNFDEFFLFNRLINQGSLEEKLKLIFRLYDRDKKKYLTRQQLENILSNMFDLLNLSKSKNGLSQNIEKILNRANFSSQNTKISWSTFSTYVLNDPSLFAMLVSNDIEHDEPDDDIDYLVTRF